MNVKRKIYVASSWRNEFQPSVVGLLREEGHEVYDFRNPTHGQTGFSWAEIDTNWQQWTPAEYQEALQHPIAKRGYKSDKDAMVWCNTCVLVLPSGRSASFEAGWCLGAGKDVIVYMPVACEPELMYAECPITTGPKNLTFSLSNCLECWGDLSSVDHSRCKTGLTK